MVSAGANNACRYVSWLLFSQILLNVSGSSSVLLDDLVVAATQMPTSQFGLIFMGEG
jgi:hypothetical protein